MAKAARVYWDACTWIAYINQEKNIPLDSGNLENRFAMCREMLRGAEEGKLEIVTSAFTLAAVWSHAALDLRRIVSGVLDKAYWQVCKSPEVRDSPIDNLPSFFERSYILIVPVDMAIARRAQSMQVSLSNLKPPDAIHLSSAQRASVCELHTFDKRILDLDGQLAGSSGQNIKICKPTKGSPIGPLFSEE